MAAIAAAAKADQETAKTIHAVAEKLVNGGDDDDDQLFELDIGLLDRRNDDEQHHRVHWTASPPGGHDDGGQALLANCLLPASSVSRATPVTAASRTSAHYWVGVGSKRLAGGRRRFGRPAGNSAWFCFSNRGFEALAKYQRN